MTMGRHPGSPPLWSANSVEMMELLLDQGANLDFVRSDSGNALLHHVARRGNSELVELLLNQGMNIDAANNDGETPLHIAVRRASGDASTPRDLELVELLLNRGANVEAANNDGETPLDVATNSKVVDLLSNR